MTPGSCKHQYKQSYLTDGADDSRPFAGVHNRVDVQLTDVFQSSERLLHGQNLAPDPLRVTYHLQVGPNHQSSTSHWHL